MSGPVQLTPVDLGPGIGAGFSTRYGGVSLPPYDELNLAYHVPDDVDRVTANRDLLARQTGQADDRFCYVHQVHGAQVRVLNERMIGHFMVVRGGHDADAMVTAVTGAPLAILVADCVPVLLADPVARVVGAAHAGRKGLVSGVVPATIDAMVALGAEPSRMTAVIGPSICAACYEVPEDMAAAVEAAVPGTASLTRSGTPSVDLAVGVASHLGALGSVAHDQRCTAESPDLYSYRRDGVTGRFAGAIWLAP